MADYEVFLLGDISLQSGATLSGPLRKGKTFFFASFERDDIHASNAVTIAASRRLLLRESWIEVRPSKKLTEVPDPCPAVSPRERSPRTWCG